MEKMICQLRHLFVTEVSVTDIAKGWQWSYNGRNFKHQNGRRRREGGALEKTKRTGKA
jgi:hypothetical protein